VECVTGAHLLALGWTFDYMDKNKTYVNVTLPDLPEEYAQHTNLCAPQSLVDQWFTALEEKAQELGDPEKSVENQKRSARTSIFDKRARNCKQMQEAEISGVHQYSCSSAAHPSQCSSCARWSTSTFITAMAACAYKSTNNEQVQCCATAVLAYGTYYTQTCLAK
ncbi:hypothetical protein M436DRAFT_26272, partial [Aureobasidium namibiae CBS 147.97]